MSITIPTADDITRMCVSTPVDSEHGSLLRELSHGFPNIEFVHVLTRGGWHRHGGVINNEGECVSDRLRDWVETQCAGDVNKLIDRYAGSGFTTTRLIGKTHYFVAQTGISAEDFVQLEIEELQEVSGPDLINIEAPPENLEDVIEPLEVEYTAGESIGKPRYALRQITAISEYMHMMSKRIIDHGNKPASVQRFMQDWDRSSAKEAGDAFCYHWVLSMREYTDAWGEHILQARPVSTYVDTLSKMNLNGEHRGSRLANLVHGIDNAIGYPMAWFFFMLSRTEIPYQLAEAIHRDLMGAYDYLPARDLKVLKDWSVNPYSV
jgi:hypothetical protein